MSFCSQAQYTVWCWVAKLQLNLNIDVVMTNNTAAKTHKFMPNNLPKIIVVVLLAIGTVTTTLADDTASAFDVLSNRSNDCLKPFYRDVPPLLNKASLKKHNYALCMTDFNVMYSGVSKTPLWSAEYLSPKNFQQQVKREDNFHEESRVQLEHRALLSDYRASGYDRGHMAPSGDMRNRAAQNDSFSLVNIIPQAQKNNQEVWRKLEEAVRAIVTKQQQEVYVLTGPLFEGQRLKTIGQGVFVPTAVYKAIYVPQQGVIGAYYAPNDDSQQVEVLSVCALEEKLGINLFPQLSEQQKRNIYHLPLSAPQVKAKQDIAYSHWDGKSQCAVEATTDEIQAQQHQFTLNSAEPMESQFPPIAEPLQHAMIQQLVNALLQYFLQLLR